MSRNRKAQPPTVGAALRSNPVGWLLYFMAACIIFEIVGKIA